MHWYYSKSGTQQGPVTEAVLREKISSGEIGQADLIWRDGMSDWMPVSKVPEMAGFLGVSPGPVLDSAPVRPAFPVEPSEQASPYSQVTAPAPYSGNPDVPSYLWQSIVVTLLCCLPFGIPAIVYAARVDSLKRLGDFQGAANASNTARQWCLAALISGLIIIALSAVSGLLVPGHSPR